MALTLAQLQAKRDELLASLATPLSVTFADRTVMERSISEKKKAMDLIDAEISKLAGRSKQSLGVASKGLA